MVGYLRWVARNHPAAFCSMLGKLLPLQVNNDARQEVIYRTVEEVQEEIMKLRLPLRRVLPLIAEDVGRRLDDDE